MINCQGGISIIFWGNSLDVNELRVTREDPDQLIVQTKHSASELANIVSLMQRIDNLADSFEGQLDSAVSDSTSIRYTATLPTQRDIVEFAECMSDSYIFEDAVNELVVA